MKPMKPLAVAEDHEDICSTIDECWIHDAAEAARAALAECA